MTKKNKKNNTISPAEEKIVKELIAEGREKGFITIDEINENLGEETPSPEQLEKYLAFFLRWILRLLIMIKMPIL